MKTKELPTWEEVADKIARGHEVTVIEWFIYRNQPSNPVKSTIWRAELLEVINKKTE